MNERQVNQAAFRQLNGFIQKTYAPGRFVAISGGKVIADAVDFEGLHSRLRDMGNNSADVLVVQAGMDYPEDVCMPELALDVALVGYSSDHVEAASKRSCADFVGLAGLPLLRSLEYGGNADWFWLRPAPIGP